MEAEKSKLLTNILVFKKVHTQGWWWHALRRSALLWVPYARTTQATQYHILVSTHLAWGGLDPAGCARGSSCLLRDREVGRAWRSKSCDAECRMFVSKRGCMESLCSEDMRYRFSALVCACACVHESKSPIKTLPAPCTAEDCDGQLIRRQPNT